jgi:hypothetical protein
MGQIGANLGNKNVVDPRQAQWGDLDSSEKSARLIGGGVQGLNRGMQNYNGQPQNSGMGGFQMQTPQQPQVQLPGMTSQAQQNQDLIKRAGGMSNNPYFYGYGGS